MYGISSSFFISDRNGIIGSLVIGSALHEVPTVAIVPKDKTYTKMISNIEEIKARRGKIIAVATENDKAIKKLVDDVIYIPKINEILYPILTVIPLQLLAYHIADQRECDIDHPRNLAKSVTVE